MLVVVLSLAAQSVWVSSSHAQGQVLGALRGTVKDEHGMLLPGASLTAALTDGTLTYETTTDASGYYVLPQLPPGEYEVTAALTGFTTLAKPGVSIRTGMSVSLDLVLSVGGVTERVTVGRAPQLLESSSAAQTVNITGELARALPLSSRRRLDDLLLAVPGVAFDEMSANLNMYSVNGSPDSQHNVLVDGVEVKQAKAGVISDIQLSFEALKDVQITTSGQDPSAPLGNGVLINIATESGQNQIRATASGLFQPRSWLANNLPDVPTASSPQPRRYSLVDGSVGGPLRRDRAWFFGTARFEDSSQLANVTADQLALFSALLPGYEPPRADYNDVSFLAKGTLALSANHLTSAFVQRDRRSTLSASGDVALPTGDAIGGATVGWRLNSVWSSHFSSQARFSYTDRATDLPLVDASVPQRRIYREARRSGSQVVGVTLLGLPTNIREQAVDRQATRLTTSFDVLWQSGQVWGGRHDVNFGVYLAPRVTARDDYHYANGGYAQEDAVLSDPADLTSPTRVFARRVYDGATLHAVDARLSDNAVYVGDTWRPHPRITGRFGVRIDRVRQRDLVFDQVTQATTAIGPRFGANVLLTEDGSLMARASWGRIHQAPVETTVSLGSNALGYRQEFDADGDGIFESVFTTPGATQLNPNQIVDLARWRVPHIDETTAGLTRRVGGQSTVSVAFTRRAYKNRGTRVEVNAQYDEANRFVGYANESQNSVNLITNNIWNWPIGNTLDLTFAGRWGRADFVAGYSRQWRSLEGSWQPGDIAGILQPDAFPSNKGLAAVGEIASGGSYGERAFISWRDHVGRLAVNWQAPWDVLVSSQVAIQSGPWSGPLLYALAAPDLSYGPATVHLSNGRVVENPLATLTRFVGPTRDDGQVQLDTYASWNLRLGRRFRVGRLSVDAYADVFNVLNAGTPVSFASGATTQGNPAYLQPARIQQPRVGQLSFRVAF